MSWPSKLIEPLLGRMIPIRDLTSVVLPMPLWPSIPIVSRSRRSRSTAWMIGILPYPARSWRTSSMLRMCSVPEVDVADGLINEHIPHGVFDQDRPLVKDGDLARNHSNEVHVVLDDDHGVPTADRADDVCCVNSF